MVKVKIQTLKEHKNCLCDMSRVKHISTRRAIVLNALEK